MNANPDELRELILNCKEPLLFKKLLTSKLLNWTLEDWNRILKDKELEFRTGVYKYTKDPQWERKTNIIKGLFEYFLNQTKTQTNNWLYFDYKYLKDWLTDAENLRHSITWAPLGFPNITADDCTIWIGSKGAHTPCHVDTYGFNLVFQIYGKKLWIVSPPEENLIPTRVPYEESSIYSKLNFFSPTIEDFRGINNCRKIILNPGEVLFLPHKWWHYVENLETAISINVWIPLPEDDEERLKESVVQLLVKQIVGESSKEMNNHILNPNMDEVLLHNNFDRLLETLNVCRNIYKRKISENKKFKGEQSKNNDKNNEVNQDVIIEKYRFIEKIPKLSSDELKNFLEAQRDRFEKNTCTNPINLEDNVVEFLNVLTDPEVVSLISEKLLANRT